MTFVSNQIYKHKVIRVNYTTYDGRRDQDSLNPRTHADFMVMANEDDESDTHPFWYGRIIGIFHVFVRHSGPASNSNESQRLNFLWVRWLGRDLSYKSGFKAKRYPRVGFVNDDSSDMFGFLDPRALVRGVHLIPAFAYGKTTELLGPSIVRQPQEKHEDWVWYYVNM